MIGLVYGVERHFQQYFINWRRTDNATAKRK